MGKLTKDFLAFAKKEYGYNIQLCPSPNPDTFESVFGTFPHKALSNQNPMKKKGKQKMTIDMWYGDKFKKKKYGANAWFNGSTGKYWGWIYNDDGKVIGDYTTNNSLLISENFNIEWKS